MAESADALDLGSSGRLSLGGSNPLARTIVLEGFNFYRFYRYTSRMHAGINHFEIAELISQFILHIVNEAEIISTLQPFGDVDNQ